MSSWSRARALAGVLCKDLWRYERALASSGPAYLGICNRDERLEPAPDGSGWRCDWRWTSDLHAPQHLSALGQRLMRRALADHPIRRAPDIAAGNGTPQVAFVIGHRGNARLPHLLATLASIGGQFGCEIECIVVEQDIEQKAFPLLPSWVRYVHAPPPVVDMPYCRSWIFNIGARHAKSAVLILHDNDLLVPADYAGQVLDRVARGHEVVNLKRFIFYLTQAHTHAILDSRAELLDAAPEVIVQNTEGGGSIAITRAGFEAIGGMDESFVGWGGEDNEFWERAQTLRVWPWANLPLVHLYHDAQPGKRAANSRTARRYADLTKISPVRRIENLRTRDQGRMEGPEGWPRVITGDPESSHTKVRWQKPCAA